jgi:large subunit ribosomal protein L24
MKLRKGDTVQVLTGKDKGKQGTVLQVLSTDDPHKTDKVIVSGVNTASKHLKPGRRNKANNQQMPDRGGIVDIDMPIDVSNVAYVHKGKPVRLGYETANGKKVRVAKVGGGKTEVIG